MRTPGVLIIGAGIGGLTAALSLHAVGISATVIERSREIRPRGVGINVQPQAVQELIELGLGHELAATAIPTAEHVYLDRSGNPIFAEPRGLAAGYDCPQYSVHRGELQMLLLAAVRERLDTDAVRTGTRLERFEQTTATVRAQVVNRATKSAQEIEADTLIGADGLHSMVRAQLHPDQGPLLWSGVRMWRGVTEGEPFLGGRSMIIVQDGSGVQFLAYPISRRALDRGRALINWVCQVPVSEPGPLTEDANWNRPGRSADVLPYYTGWAGNWLDVPGLITGSTEILEYPMVDRDPLPTWGRGRVTLLGDAAHPMYPVGANGASQAIIDARVLAAELTRSHDPITGLRSYENARRGATAGVVLANREMHRAGNAATGRAPQNRTRGGELVAITASYRRVTGHAME